MYAWQVWEQEVNSMMTTQSEREDLATHVDNCAMRYDTLDKRLTKLEEKIDKLEEKIEGFRLDFFKISVGTAGSIIVAIIGALAIIKWG